MKLAILARRTPVPEPQHARYREVALARGHDVVDLDSAAFVNGGVSLAVGGALVLGGVDVVTADMAGGIDAVLLGPLPGAAARTTPDDALLSATRHAALTRRQLERHQLAWAFVRELEQRGVPVVSPTASHLFDEKPTQLFALQRAGLPVPLTRFADSVAATDAAHVVKAISGGPARVAERVPGACFRGAAAIVQERIRGSDLRVVVVGGKAIAVARYEDDSGDNDGNAGNDDDLNDVIVDFRERPAFVAGTSRWVHDDDGAAAAFAVAAAAVCGVAVAAVDLKRGPAGLFVLEVNRTPVLLDIEADLGIGIADHVIDLVERRVAQRA